MFVIALDQQPLVVFGPEALQDVAALQLLAGDLEHQIAIVERLVDRSVDVVRRIIPSKSA